VESVRIITDRDTGRSKGFGFVTIGDDSAEKAMSQLNGKEVNGRALTVNEARPMVQRDFGGGGVVDTAGTDQAMKRVTVKLLRLSLAGGVEQ